MNRNNKQIYETSRYGDPRYITDVGGGCFFIEGKNKYVRVGGTDVIQYVDFEGGPFISVGDSLYEDREVIVESINFVKSEKDDWTKIAVTVAES
jgi:hypothetical protein